MPPAGERMATLRLLLTGYRILARHYRTKVGEIDLIVRRGDVVPSSKSSAAISWLQGLRR